jgi:hypothetical protein
MGPPHLFMNSIKNIPGYNSWRGMISRCHHKKDRVYRLYGGRGIRVCNRWRMSFINFIEDMGLRPSGSHSIERVDNNKGYYPENCIWATPDIQSRNTVRTIRITIGGKTMCSKDWCKTLGVSYSTYKYRIRYNGMSPVDALTTPNRRQHKE